MSQSTNFSRRKFLRKVAVGGLAALLTVSGCPINTLPNETPLNEQHGQHQLVGDWTTEQGIKFHFDENGILDYYGKEQFEEYAFDRELKRNVIIKNYGEGELVDNVYQNFPTEKTFSALLVRDFFQEDYTIQKHAIMEGEVIDSNITKITLSYSDEDFYGAYLGNGVYNLRKVE